MRAFAVKLFVPIFIFLAGFLALCLPSKSQETALTDFTDKLKLVPGLTVTLHIFEGLDTHWQGVGDYDFVARVAEMEKAGKGFIYDWSMTQPVFGSGSRKVDDGDVRNSRKVSLFYPKHEVCTLVGYTNVMRVSDVLYKDMKAGRTSDFALDGPDSLMVGKSEHHPLPHSITGQGTEMVQVKIEGQPAQVRAIKAVCDNGWQYWIVDNPKLPLIVQGNAPFRWVASLANIEGDGSGDANREARDIYDQLKRNGMATTYLVLFDFDSDNLRPHSKEILQALGGYLKKDSGLRLTVEGHTCTIGGYQYNMQLSKRRAASVKNYLTNACSIESSRLKSAGYGYTKPEHSNATAGGRELNRRVVFREIK